MYFESLLFVFFLDPIIEVVNASMLQPAPNEVAKDCSILAVDESCPHTFSDVHLEGVKGTGDIEIQVVNASSVQPTTNEAMDERTTPIFHEIILEEVQELNEVDKDFSILVVDESFPHTFNDVHLEGAKAIDDTEIQIVNASLVQPAMNEAMDESNPPIFHDINLEEVQRTGDSASSSRPTIFKKSILTIVLDLNGLLLRRCQNPSSLHESLQYGSKRHVVLRPGCLQFLQILLERFNVGIWSTATEDNVLQILSILQDKVREILPFFAVWSQGTCYIHSSKKLFRPDNPTVQAMFKPLAKISACFECDPRRTILIDDSPYKGCVSPNNNCIFPLKFDEGNKVDNILMDELLPYLLRLDESEDVREVIGSNRYGQLPICNDNEYKDVIDKWKDLSLAWSQRTINTDRLPLAEKLRDLFNKQEAERSEQEIRRDQIKEILGKEKTNVDSMKPVKLISLARKLGCKTGTLTGLTAKAFIKKVLNEHNLLKLDTNR